MSFSLALAGQVGLAAQNMTSTTFQRVAEYSETTIKNASALRRIGATVIPGVDARNLPNWFGQSKFDSIVFQFPNVWSRTPLYGRNPSHVLIRRFLKSAAEHLTGNGIVAISAVNSSHHDGAFDVDGAAECNEYEIPVAHPFYFSDYPGYSHVKTKDDGSSAVGEGDEFVTYVFHKKKQVVREMGSSLSNTSADLPPGAFYLPSFISSEEEAGLVSHLDAGKWSMELKRRVQHFGYRYDYRARTVTSEAYLGPFPGWLRHINERLVATALFASAPDQVIANEYQPGQGISAHVDCVPCFDDTIVSLSLLSHCEMVFRERRGGEKLTVVLEPCSAIVMTGAARYDWTHEIPARKSDSIDGIGVHRARRVSLTFRKVVRTI